MRLAPLCAALWLCAAACGSDDLDAAGDYTITLTKGGQDQVLTKGVSKSIPSSAASYTVGADCGGGQLALYANGTKIASASDSSYTTGDVGLFAWTGDGAPAEVHYDDLIVTKLGGSSTATK